jgi:hypothetical protein
MQLDSKIGFISNAKSTWRFAAGGSEFACSGVILASATWCPADKSNSTEMVKGRFI